MVNALTGDFDVVVECAIPAANRVLAAMHRNERFLHSISVRVDDNPPPGSKFPRPSIGGSMDTFGDPIVNHQQIGLSGFLPGQLTAKNPLLSLVDTVVNAGSAGIFDPPVVPSHLQGRAQLQLSPPTIEVPDASGTNLTVRMHIMSRYLPDKNTSPAAEFIHADLLLTAPISHIASQAGNVVDVDIKADQVGINFNVAFSSRPLSAEDLAGINLLIRNALKTGFLPSNAAVPAKVTSMQFKTLLGSPNSVAVLLNLLPLSLSGAPVTATPPGHPGTVNNVFLSTSDDFAFAVSSDFVQAAFPNIRDHRFPPIWEYTIVVNSPTLEFQSGRILLTIKGHAHTSSSFLPDFDFFVKQALILNLVATVPGGPLDTAELAPLGDISIEINGIPDFVVNQFTGSARDVLRAQRDSQLTDINRAVRDTLDADKNLGTFLRSLLNPARRFPTHFVRGERPGVTLSYSSVEIRPQGIVLHGSLNVLDWPAAHVEFEEIPVNKPIGVVVTTGFLLGNGPDYSALKTWIPGGAIQRYEWSSQGQTQPFLIDNNKFVLLPPPPVLTAGAASSGTPSAAAVSAFSPLCLTVRGTRISSSGPAVPQPVTASVCAFGTFPIVGDLNVAVQGEAPLIALTQPGSRGQLEITGHTPAQAAQTRNGSRDSMPNVLVHFANDQTSGHLEFLTQALHASGRKDAVTAVLAVLTSAQLSKARHVPDIIYGEEQAGAWERAFGLKSVRLPFTLIVAPNGKTVFQHEGDLDAVKLAAELRKFLIAGGAASLGIVRLGLRLNETPPNFLFEFARGREMTLAKLEGPAILVFWKSTSQPSIDAVSDLQRVTDKSAGLGPVILAVNVGESIDVAKRAAAEHKFSAVLVTDPKRAISIAYGVGVLPTTVFLNEFGLVTQVRYGRITKEPSASPSGEKPGAAQ